MATEAGVRISVLGADDVAAWRAVRLEGLERYPGAFLITPEEARAQPLDAIARMLGRGNSFGAFQGGVLVGIGSLVPEGHARTRHRGEIGAFYVTDAAQGSSAARDLLAAIEARARHLGIVQLELNVAANNPRAVRFYERSGYRHMATLRNAVMMPDGLVDDFLYAKELS